MSDNKLYVVPKGIKEHASELMMNINMLTVLYPESPLDKSMAWVLQSLQYGENSRAVAYLNKIKYSLETDERFQDLTNQESLAYRDDVYLNPKNIAIDVEGLMNEIKERFEL